MEYCVAVLMIYAFVAFIVGLTLNTLIVSMLGVDREFDDAMANNKIRFVAVVLLSIFWVISVPVFMYNSKIN